MIYLARMLDRDDTTTRQIEADASHQAPDEYVAKFCRHVPGLAFVQVQEGGDARWVTWRVEIIQAGPPLIMFTAMVTEEAARAELAEGVSR